MKQEQKNLLLIIALAVLVACSIALSFSTKPRMTTFTESDLFAISDTASIHSIRINSSYHNIENVLERTANGWTINEIYEADPSMTRVLLSVLQQVTISRTVAKNQAQSIRDDVLEKGYKIEIEGTDHQISTFYCLGNSTKTMSILMKEDSETPHIVNLPGYDSYVAGIFEVTELDWRNRLIFNSTWRTVQRLELLYPQYSYNNVEIRFNLDFFEITGVDAIDTTAMMNFIDEFQYFQADRFINRQPALPMTASYQQILILS